MDVVVIILVIVHVKKAQDVRCSLADGRMRKLPRVAGLLSYRRVSDGDPDGSLAGRRCVLLKWKTPPEDETGLNEGSGAPVRGGGSLSFSCAISLCAAAARLGLSVHIWANLPTSCSLCLHLRCSLPASPQRSGCQRAEILQFVFRGFIKVSSRLIMRIK